MADYFTSDHFKLLNKWQGQKRDDSNPEQNRAYEDLTQAFVVTERWAKGVQELQFPDGYINVRKRPTSQANSFLPYNWAKIYPQKSSPKELAYTVGIDAQHGFIVKIDTVGLDDLDARRKKYMSLRGDKNDKSPIIAVLPAADGLTKSLSELIDWSIEAVKNFELKYDDVAKRLGLSAGLDTASIVTHFKGHPRFVKWQPNWPEEQTQMFCRTVTAVHNAGFDLWLGNGDDDIRFGIKEKSWKKGKPNGWVTLLQIKGNEISLKAHGDLPQINGAKLNVSLVEQIEKYCSSIEDGDTVSPIGSSDRVAYWPDDYAVDEQTEEELRDGDLQGKALNRKAFNRIYYGPPGTGKTYELLQLLKKDYTDEEEVPDPDSWLVDQMGARGWFEVIALILMDAGQPLKVADIVAHRFYQGKATANSRTNNLTQTAWGYLQRHTWSKSNTVEYAKERRAAIAVFDKDTLSNWYIVDELKEQLNDLLPVLAYLKAGPEPGTANERYKFVTFHQSYGYEEFVEGLRPKTDTDATDQIQYDIVPGPLRELCALAEADKAGRFYALVIDEINRGNISKIFGELITLIEIDKRAGSEFTAPTRLAYSGDSFIIPPNVDFIGSMNTADRSLALVDTALRRRFEFVSKLPAPEVLKGLVVVEKEVPIHVEKLLETINSRIEALYDRDHTIGHAYFTHIAKLDTADQFSALRAAFKNKIIPLLEEYFFEDWQKIRLVLGDNQKNEKFQFIQDVGRDDDLSKLFGQNHELDQYSVRARYRLVEESLDLPQAYVGIYAPGSVAES